MELIENYVYYCQYHRISEILDIIITYVWFLRVVSFGVVCISTWNYCGRESFSPFLDDAPRFRHRLFIIFLSHTTSNRWLVAAFSFFILHSIVPTFISVVRHILSILLLTLLIHLSWTISSSPIDSRDVATCNGTVGQPCVAPRAGGVRSVVHGRILVRFAVEGGPTVSSTQLSANPTLDPDQTAISPLYHSQTRAKPQTLWNFSLTTINYSNIILCVLCFFVSLIGLFLEFLRFVSGKTVTNFQ